jgi:tyrosine-protein kinase Etk/Wzc
MNITLIIQALSGSGLIHIIRWWKNTGRSLLLVYQKIFLPSLNLAVQDYNIEKGKMFLSRLTQVYLDNNLEKKNQTAERTIQFIDSQLENISDSLNISEGRLETFRSSNQVIDFSAQSQQLLAQLNQLDNEVIRHKNQNKYYNYLKEYIETNQDMETVIAPSSIGIEDPLLNSFIIQLNTLINEKTSQTSIRPNSEHPTFIQLNTQIEIVKNSLRQSINNIIRQSDIELENLELRMMEYDAQIRRLPATERNFVNFERRYRIDSETYTFLLQKLSEARIAKASSMPDGQMLEKPFLKALVSPQRNRIFSIALLLGLIFPASVILIRDLFNDKIIPRKMLQQLQGIR